MTDEIRAVLDGVRVLYVEDHDDTRDITALLLGGAGATVLAVASADEALAALEREQPDVLVSDTRMPGRSGWELIEQVRTWSRARGGQTPAIAVTGAASDEDRAHSLLSGFDAHISKPIDVDELVRTIATLAGRGDVSTGATSKTHTRENTIPGGRSALVSPAGQAPPGRRLQPPPPDGRTAPSTARVAEDASGADGLEGVCCTNS